MAYHPPPERLQFQRIRVAAVIIESGRVLLVAHQFPDQSRAWLLPGGGVELGETLVQATARELQEETGLEAEIERLVFWREFFDWRYTLELTFLARPTGGRLGTGYDPEFEDQVIKEVAWFPLADLAKVNIVPAVLRQRLPEAWRSGFKDHINLGLTESFAEALLGWVPGSAPASASPPQINLP